MIATAIMCLALNVYHESRGEPLHGQQAVALVTMNRAGGDPKRVCKEVYRKGQFSWTKQGRPAPAEQKAWRRARQIAADVVHRRMVDFTGGATHFHHKTVRPKWRGMKLAMSIGSHRFYRVA